MARKIETKSALINAGWRELSTWTFMRNGYTAMINDESVVMLSPIGKRIERKFT